MYNRSSENFVFQVNQTELVVSHLLFRLDSQTFLSILCNLIKICKIPWISTSVSSGLVILGFCNLPNFFAALKSFDRVALLSFDLSIPSLFGFKARIFVKKYLSSYFTAAVVGVVGWLLRCAVVGMVPCQFLLDLYNTWLIKSTIFFIWLFPIIIDYEFPTKKLPMSCNDGLSTQGIPLYLITH